MSDLDIARNIALGVVFCELPSDFVDYDSQEDPQWGMFLEELGNEKDEFSDAFKLTSVYNDKSKTDCHYIILGINKI